MCDSTFTHMCTGAWSGRGTGPTPKCKRCHYKYCKYHKKINNSGAEGGHLCVCEEGAKKTAYGLNCGETSDFDRCPHCSQRVCPYHAPPNRGGMVGGHDCSGPKCSVDWGTCRGFVTKKCKCCDLHYCSAHLPHGGRLVGGGHACDIGCQTTIYTKGNCCGTKNDVKPCPICPKGNENYKFCPYHIMPVKTLLHLKASDDSGGGHVCKGRTSGSMMLGDSFGDYFDLAMQLAITASTGGTVNPLAATISANAIKTLVWEFLDSLGLVVLFGIVTELMELHDKFSAYKEKKSKNAVAKGKGREQASLFEEAVAILTELEKVLGSVKKLANKVSELKKLLELKPNNLSVLETAIKTFKEIHDFKVLVENLQSYLPKLTDMIKARPPDPFKIFDTIKETKEVMGSVKAVM